MNDDFTQFNGIYNDIKSVLDDIGGELDNDIVKEGQAGTDDGWSKEIPDDIFEDSPNFLVYQIKMQEAQNKALEENNNGNE